MRAITAFVCFLCENYERPLYAGLHHKYQGAGTSREGWLRRMDPGSPPPEARRVGTKDTKAMSEDPPGERRS
ncbi:hypothetical protein E2C01_011984 [Portunus trituberculatus]|uniref:Uncharacterized protein n=1 Tax=Portunus trituberculatus TaxID=210409 RepID=A0A5B7DCR7_PORTR|nr:hypothetical protein [Portunus trituberculatus]